MPDPTSCIQFSPILPKKARIILYKTCPGPIFMTWTGLGQTNLVRKQAGVQESSGLVLVQNATRCHIQASLYDMPGHDILLPAKGNAGVKENDRADRLASKATLTSGLLLGRSEVLRSLRHYMRAQSQGHHTTDRLEERGVERGTARQSSLKG